MSNPDIQFFAVSGMWVKPPGAVRVDIVLAGGDGGNLTYAANTTGPKAVVVHGGVGGGVGTGPAGQSSGATVIGGSGGGASHIGDYPRHASAAASSHGSGTPGTLSVVRLDADDLPDTVEVTVGKGGRPGGRDGYALIIAHVDTVGGQAGEH